MADEVGNFYDLYAQNIKSSMLNTGSVFSHALTADSSVSIYGATVTADRAYLRADSANADLSNGSLNLKGCNVNMADSHVYLNTNVDLKFGKLTISTSQHGANAAAPCEDSEDCEVFRHTTMTADFDHVVTAKFNPLCFHCTRFNPRKFDVKKAVEEHYKDIEVDKKLEVL